MRDIKCVFCKKIKDGGFKRTNSDLDGVIYFEPLNPVTKGHLLVVPIRHIEDFTEEINLSCRVYAEAINLAKMMGDVNLITSKGEDATQTIRHLHIHLIPRRKNDKLKLPWTNQKKENPDLLTKENHE